ncbi:MAG: hypothetical protein ACOC4H_02815, partial [bacterium]
MINKKGYLIKKVVFSAVIFAFSAGFVFAAEFTENFNDNLYKDDANTTANWNTTDNRVQLDRDNRFAETTGVVNWGGGVTAIEYNADDSLWLLGGEGGKLNSYNGVNFINLSVDLGFGTNTVNDIHYNGDYWLICGSGKKLKSYDGSSFTDLAPELVNFPGDVRAAAYKDTPSTYWLIGGASGALNRFDGTDWTDEKTNLGFGASDVNAIVFNGSYWLIIGDDGKIAKYDGASWSDLSSSLETALGGVYDLYTVDYSGSTFLIGGGDGKLVSYNGTSFTDRSSSVSMTSIWSIHHNGSYWIIAGSSGSVTRYYTSTDLSTFNLQANETYFDSDPVWAVNSSGSGVNLLGGRNSRILKREGGASSPSNTDLSGEIKDFGKNNIRCAGRNGSYWLIGGDSGSLNMYDGSSFTDLKSQLGFGDRNVLSIGWNGSYWLIGGTSGRLSVYDGVSFTSKTTQLGFGSYSVNAIEWEENGSYWIIGGGG